MSCGVAMDCMVVLWRPKGACEGGAMVVEAMGELRGWSWTASWCYGGHGVHERKVWWLWRPCVSYEGGRGLHGGGVEAMSELCGELWVVGEVCGEVWTVGEHVVRCRVRCGL